MAINYVNGTTAANSNTGTNQLVVTYTSTAGNLLVAAISINAQVAVTSVVDSAGNAWHVSRAAQRTGGPDTEIWKTDAVNAAAVTSITVTIAANGKFAVVIGEYSGVAYAAAQNGAGGGTGTTSTLALTIVEANDWVLCAIGAQATTTMAATTGNLRNQATSTAVTPASVGLMDNTAASISSVSCIATLGGNNNFESVIVELRLLGNTSRDTMTMSDRLALSASLAAADQLVQSDAINLLFPLIKALNDSLNNWQDAVTTGQTIITKAFADSLNNWLDLFIFVLGTPRINETLSDSLNNWQDSLTKDLLALGALVSQVIVEAMVVNTGAVAQVEQVVIEVMISRAWETRPIIWIST